MKNIIFYAIAGIIAVNLGSCIHSRSFESQIAQAISSQSVLMRNIENERAARETPTPFEAWRAAHEDWK